jgi:hypothetical protein
MWWLLGLLVIPPLGTSPAGAARLDDEDEIARVAKMIDELVGIFIVDELF